MQKLIIVRGVSGAGKSTYAKELAQEIDAVLLETDDFWYEDGEYKFNFKRLGEAHRWNQDRARRQLEMGNTVIIANTNIKYSDFKTYVQYAQEMDVQVDFKMVPQFQDGVQIWSGVKDYNENGWVNGWNYKHLEDRNTHGVPAETIRRMCENFQWNV